MEYYKPYLNNFDTYNSGIITFDSEEYFVNEKNVSNNRALHGDMVYINEENEVIGIKTRNNNFITGILHLNGNTKYGFTNKNVPYYKFSPISNKYPPFIVPCKDKRKTASYCVIKFNKWETKNKNPIGMLEYFIGNVGIMENEINMLLYKTNIYPKKNKIKYLPITNLNPSDLIDYNTFSIDPKDCKDIDDALHYNSNDNGNTVIGIHIANVAKYIESYDTNYYSSIYLKNKQLNMLNDTHSFDKCSLGNGEKKYALSLILNFNGFVLENYEFKQTIIKNTALSYNDVEEIIGKTESGNIYKLWEFTCCLKNNRELKATEMVEFYMLLYNKLVAETLYKNNVNTILRTHKVNTNMLETSDPELKSFLNKINQNSAKYEINPKDTNHEDLSLTYYTHATSPIRRYVDIINQKNIINVLGKSDLLIETKEKIDSINLFQKNLRKFYNYYKKLQLIFEIDDSRLYSAFVININNLYVNVYIHELDITHSFQIISKKLLNVNKVETNDKFITVNGVKIDLFQKILIKLTTLKYEENFNRKINIELINPAIYLF